MTFLLLNNFLRTDPRVQNICVPSPNHLVDQLEQLCLVERNRILEGDLVGENSLFEGVVFGWLGCCQFRLFTTLRLRFLVWGLRLFGLGGDTRLRLRFLILGLFGSKTSFLLLL